MRDIIWVAIILAVAVIAYSLGGMVASKAVEKARPECMEDVIMEAMI